MLVVSAGIGAPRTAKSLGKTEIEPIAPQEPILERTEALA
jgi:hypothetical protein